MKIKKLRRTKGQGSIVKRGKIYYISYISRSNGKRVFESSHSSNKSDAENLLRERLIPNQILDDKERLEFFKYQIKSKENDLELIEKAKCRIPIDDILDEYFKRGFSSNNANATKNIMQVVCNSLVKYLREFAKIDTLDKITKQITIDYMKHLMGKLLPSSYNAHLTYLRAIFRDLELPNYFMGIPKLHTDGSKREPFTWEMINKVEDYLGKKPKYKDELMLFRLGYFTAQRESDCACVKISDIDFDRNMIHFEPIKTKKYHKKVSVPMFPQLAIALREYIADGYIENDDGFLLPRMEKKWRRNCLANFWRRVFKRVGIEVNVTDENGHVRPKYTFHSLRHFWVSQACNSGISLDYIKHITAHSGNMIERYAHFDDENVCRTIVNELIKKVPELSAENADDVIDVEANELVDVKIDKDIYDTVMKFKASDDMSFSDCLKIALEGKSI